MASVSRSSAHSPNVNRFRVHQVTVFIQRYAGTQGTDLQRTAGEQIDYTVYINGRFSQTGQLAADGSVTLMIPGGCTAELEVLGTVYEIVPEVASEPPDTVAGIQQRLRQLGYYSQDVQGIWDSHFDQAVLNFQADYGLDPTGNGLDEATVEQLKNELGE